MKPAYDYWANQANEMRAGIDFDPDCVTADDLQMMQTREAILRKLAVIFNGRSHSSSESSKKQNCQHWTGDVRARR